MESQSKRAIAFINIGHALDHYVLLIFPTAVLAIAAERGVGYGELIGLSTGAFLAFGLCSMPAAWLADRYGRRNLFAAFFFGCGAACLGMATATSSFAFAAWLLMLGVFSAIYHPVGTAMLVAEASAVGRALGVNGVWGNLGAAFASGSTAFIAARFGWRASFVVPGLVCLAVGAAYVALVHREGAKKAAKKSDGASMNGRVGLMILALAVLTGGMTFNIVTIALPAVIDERLGLDLPLTLIGSLATAVFVLGALTQLVVGRIIDRMEIGRVFLGLAVFQPIGLAIAAATTGVPMLFGLVLAMAAIYGQVVVNDAMIARAVAPEFRAKAYGIRYFIGFAAAGTAVPLIGILHGASGFPLVLMVAAVFGLAIAACALSFFLLVREAPRAAAAE